MFYLDNLSIQYPFAIHERVPVGKADKTLLRGKCRGFADMIMRKVWSVIYSGVVPLLVIAAWTVLVRREAHVAHVSILGLLATLLITSFITDIIKNAVGRPRPDLISRCNPKKGTPDHTLIEFSACSPTDKNILQEGFRSFPSGHSSFAFAGFGYLFLYVYLAHTHRCLKREIIFTNKSADF